MKLYIYVLLPALLVSNLQAQTPVAPTPVNPAEVIDLSSFKITSAFELGYRFNLIGGDESFYRSNVNYGNGVRLLSNSFTANSKDGHGKYFDELSLSTQGLGNDPYQVALIRAEKNGWYRYDGTWRTNNYTNPLQISGESGALKNSHRDMEDHDVFITPAKWLKLRAGFTRVENRGPAIQNLQLYISGLYPLPTPSERGATHGESVLPLLDNLRQDSNDYRFGGDIEYKGFRLSLTRQLSYYKEDSSYNSLVPGQPYSEPNKSVATSYFLSAPMHVQTPTWFGTLSTVRKSWSMNGRISYMKSSSQFAYDEAATGYLSTGTVANGQISTITLNNALTNVATWGPSGAARRPYVSGDYSFTYQPTERLSITSDTSAFNNRVDSTSQILQTSTNAATKNIFWGFYMDVARYGETLDANYRVTPWLALNANYMYTDRSVDQRTYRMGTTTSNAPGAVSNHVNMESVGFRLKPFKTLSVSLDAGVGRDNGPFTPESLARYHTLRGRIDYRTRKLRLSGTYRQLYNLNAPVLYSYSSSHQRTISGTASYQLRGNWSLDASYSKLHQDTFSELYVELPSAAGPITNVRGYNSIYLSNVHSATFLMRGHYGRTTFSAGYNLVLDAGDGRSQQNLGLTNVALAYLASAQTFPMTYQAPLARLSIKILPKLQWNAGWEFYRYNQQFATFGYQPYYRAQTGYTSLLFTY